MVAILGIIYASLSVSSKISSSSVKFQDSLVVLAFDALLLAFGVLACDGCLNFFPSFLLSSFCAIGCAAARYESAIGF